MPGEVSAVLHIEGYMTHDEAMEVLGDIRAFVTLDYFKELASKYSEDAEKKFRLICQAFHKLDLHLTHGGRLPASWNSPRLMTEVSEGFAHQDVLLRCENVLKEQRKEKS